MSSSSLRTPSSGRTWLARHQRVFVAALIIVVVEVVFFNFGFWKTQVQTHLQGRSLPAAVSLTSVTLGPGLTKSAIPDVLTVTDPSASYVEVSDIDNDVDSIRITPTSAQPATTSSNGTESRYDSSAPDFEWWATVRVDAFVTTVSANGTDKTTGTWIKGDTHQFSPASPSSTYIELKKVSEHLNAAASAASTNSGSNANSAASTNSGSSVGTDSSSDGKVTKLRVWYLQPEQSSFAFAGVSVNERRGFSFNLARVAFMAIIAAFILGFRPGSRLYRTRFDTTDRHQRRILLLSLLPFAALFIGVVIAQTGYIPLTSWKEAGDYTYDFDQYAHLADSLLKGTPWLDLPVPDALASATNPYSTQTRAQLLAQGTSPIFWDHAFWNGHWYCYFGVLPAVVFYLPIQAFTSLWIPSGISVPTPDVVVLLLGLFALTGSLLVIRLIARHFPNTSLGMAILCVFGFLSGGNLFFLAFRLNFYAVPMLSSLVLTCLGLWLWLGARRVGKSYWTVTDGPVPDLMENHSLRLSKVRVGLGFLCMAANLGCRPTFVLAAFLAFPVFWEEIRAGWFFSCLNPHRWRDRKNPRARSPWSSIGNDAAALLPAAAICVPILAYNFWRFGSFLDFGNDYQLTVTDLTTYREPVSLIAPITYYYLFQPLHVTSDFPLLSLTETPLKSWQLTEPHAGGFFWLVPFAVLGLVALLMHRSLKKHHLWGIVAMMLGMAALLCVFDAYKAGLSWRYMADFGWLIAIAAVAAACALEEWGRSRLAHTLTLETHPDPDVGDSRLERVEVVPSVAHSGRALSTVRFVVALLVGLSLLIAVLTCFMPGRIDNLMVNASQFYFEVKAWFTGFLG
jgi:hypothetical protein